MVDYFVAYQVCVLSDSSVIVFSPGMCTYREDSVSWMSVGLLWGRMWRSTREKNLSRRIPEQVVIVQNIDLFMRLLAKLAFVMFKKILLKEYILAYRN